MDIRLKRKLEGAVRLCKKCYSEALDMTRRGYGPVLVESQTNALRYRNQAQSTLGEINHQVSEEALKACRKCDYQNRRIFDIISSYARKRKRGKD